MNWEHGLEITVDHIGSAYGQHDYEMRATSGDGCAGVLSFSEFGGIPHVNWIEVGETHAGRGIATRMVMNLQSRYPLVPIDFGYATSDGAALIDRLEFRMEPNPVYEDALAARERCNARIAQFEAACERHSTATDEERVRIIETLEQWNEVSDELEEAERVLATESRFLRFVVLQEEDASVLMM